MSDSKPAKLPSGRRPTKTIHFMMSLILLLIGVAALGDVAITNQNHSYLVKHGIRTNGIMTGCIIGTQNVLTTPGPSNRNVWMPVTFVNKCYKYSIEFQTKSGKTVT